MILHFLQNNITKEMTVKILFLILIALVISYSGTLLSLTGNAISLKKITLQNKKTDVEIARVERDFSKIVTDMNASHFETFGFTSVSNSSFAVKKDDIASFSVLYERH